MPTQELLQQKQALSPLAEAIPTVVPIHRRLPGIPEFAMASEVPYPEPQNARERIYNYITQTLWEHPGRWFSKKEVGKAAHTSRQRADQVLKCIQDINLINRTFSDEQTTLQEQQTWDLTQRGYTNEQIQKELGIPLSKFNKISPKSWEVMPDSQTTQERELEATEENIFIREMISALRLDTNRYGDREIFILLKPLFPYLTVSHVTYELEQLFTKNPEHRKRRPRGSLIGNEQLINEINNLYAHGETSYTISQKLPNLSPRDVRYILNYLSTHGKLSTITGVERRKHLSAEQTSIRFQDYWQRRKSAEQTISSETPLSHATTIFES